MSELREIPRSKADELLADVGVRIAYRDGPEALNGQGGADPNDGRLLDGISFAEEVGHMGEALCGEGDQVLWQRGEPLMIYGPQGVGKTTLAQRLRLRAAASSPRSSDCRSWRPPRRSCTWRRTVQPRPPGAGAG